MLTRTSQLNPKLSSRTRLSIRQSLASPTPTQMYPGGKVINPSSLKLSAQTMSAKAYVGETSLTGGLNNKHLRTKHSANYIANTVVGGFGNYNPNYNQRRKGTRNLS